MNKIGPKRIGKYTSQTSFKDRLDHQSHLLGVCLLWPGFVGLTVVEELESRFKRWSNHHGPLRR